MALKTPWGYDTKSYDGQAFRLLVAALTASRSGVTGVGDLKAVPSATPDDKVRVPAGYAIVPATAAGELGSYEIENDAYLNSPSIPATGAQPRWDLIILQITAGVGALVRVAGTASSSPSYPSTAGLDNFIRICGVKMPANKSIVDNGSNGTIEDLRPMWMPLVGCTSSTRPPAPFDGQRIYETDTDKLKTWNGTIWFEDANPIVCTSSTRPTGGQLFEGLQIWETDTNFHKIYNGVDWQLGGTNKRVGRKVPTGTRAITSADGIADWPGSADGPCQVTGFVKHSSQTRLIVHIDTTFYIPSGSPIPCDWYVDIAGVDTQVINSYCNIDAAHQPRSGSVEITGLAAGTYTCKVQAAVAAGPSLTCDTEDTVSITVEEVI